MCLICVVIGLPFPDSVDKARFRNITSTTEELVLDSLTGLIWSHTVNIYPPYVYDESYAVPQNASRFCQERGMRLPTVIEVLSITDFINITNDLSSVFVNGIGGLQITTMDPFGYKFPYQKYRALPSSAWYGVINQLINFTYARYHCISRNTRLEYPLKNLTSTTFQMGNLIYRRNIDYGGPVNLTHCARYGMRISTYIEQIAIYNNFTQFNALIDRDCCMYYALPYLYFIGRPNDITDLQGRTTAQISQIQLQYLCVKEIEPPKIKTRSEPISVTVSQAQISRSSTLISASKSKAQSHTTTHVLSRTKSQVESKTMSQETSRSPTTAIARTMPTTESTTQFTSTSVATSSTKPQATSTTTHQTSLATFQSNSTEIPTTIPPTTLKQKTQTLLPPPIIIPVVKLSQQEQTATSAVSAVSLVASSSAVLTSRMSALIQPVCGDDYPQEISRFQSPLLLEIGGSKRVGLIVGNVAIFSVVALTHFLLSRWKHFPNAFISPMPELTIFSYFLEPNLGTLVAMIQDGEYIAIPFLFVIIGSPPLFFWIISRKFTGTWHKRDQKKSSFFLGVGKWRNFAIWECAYGDYRGTDLPDSQKDFEEDSDTLSGKFVWKK